MSCCKKKIKLPEGFTVTHHAGSFGTPDNSLESIEYSLSKNAEIVEFDVSFHKNGYPVIIHKDEPEDNEGESFEKALELVSKTENTRINLDIKSVKNLSAVDVLCEKYNMLDRVFYTGVDAKWTAIVKENSKIPYYLNHRVTEEEGKDETAAQKLADEIKSCGAIGLNSHFEFASELVCSVMHKNGLLVSFWTLNDEENAKRIALTLPDNITTKKPDMVYEIINSLQIN